MKTLDWTRVILSIVLPLTLTNIAWSQGTANLAFASSLTGRFQVYKVQLDSSGNPLGTPQELTFGGAGNQESRKPDWSVLGTIAYQFGAPGVRGIHVMNADGSGDHQVTPSPSLQYPCKDAIDPSWSPDGHSIAYACLVSPGDYDIWIHDTTAPVGSQDSPLVTSPGSLELRPKWSPDGQTVAFVTTFGTTGGHAQISVVRVSNKVIARLTNDSFTNFDPTWSPDSAFLAFSTTRNGGHHIYRMSATLGESDTTNFVRLTTTPANNITPAWSPDGATIAFASDRSGNNNIYLMPADVGETGGLVKVTGNTSDNQQPAWEPIGCTNAGGDTDGDGLCDDWETSGVKVNINGNLIFVDLPAMGADPNHKDIFIQADYMVKLGLLGFFGHTHRPKPDAIARVTQAFANAPITNPDGKNGIVLHVDCGPTCVMNPLTGTTWGTLSKANALSHVDSLGTAPGGVYDWTAFDQIKKTNFPSERAALFHYVVFAHDLGGLDGRSGISRGITASDFIVTLGSWDGEIGTTAQQAGTLMHELGHNLSLQHGGGDGLNDKPNFLSVMNYLFQMAGLILNGSPGTLDYSRFKLPSLNENSLNENVGLGGGPALTGYGTAYYCAGVSTSTVVPNANGPIDWNCNGIIDANVTAGEINNDATLDVLTGFNDWSHIVFSGGAIGKLGLALALPSQTFEQEIDPKTDSQITKLLSVAVVSPGIAQVQPGSNINLTFRVINHGSQDDTYSIAARSTVNWGNLTGIPNKVTLAAGASGQITIPVTVPLSARSGAEGDFTIKAISQTSQEVQDSAEAILTVVISDIVPPVTSVLPSPSPNLNGWNNTDVTIGLTSTDNESGGTGVREIHFILTGAQTGSSVVSGGTASMMISAEGTTTLTYFAIDNAGNQETSKTLAISIDKTSPNAFATVSPPPNANGWNNTNVTVTFSGTDNLSGVDFCSSPITLTAEGAGQTVSGTCTDKAGNVSLPVTKIINIDKTPPVAVATPSPVPNANGWNNTDVTVTFGGTDNLSGIDFCSAPVTLTGEGAGQIVSGTCTDKAGNLSAAVVRVINIDKTPPTFLGVPVAGSCSLWPPNHKLVQVATISVRDALSGPASFDVTGTSNEPPDPGEPDIVINGTGLQPRVIQLIAERLGTGTGRIYTLTTTATDLAGNAATSSFMCTVPHDQGR